MRKKINNFKIFIKENTANATAGNTGGMGNVVSASPSPTPGDVANSIPGSGDIGSTLGTYTKKPLNLNNKNSKKKKKKKNLKNKSNYSNEQSKHYRDMYVVRFDEFNYTN